ncbi:MAG: ATP-binding protein [Candidatus Limnocylindrales bacterium]
MLLNAEVALERDPSQAPSDQSRAVTAVARVARALVGGGGLHELGGGALGAISEALGLEVMAMYVPDPDGSPVLRLFKTWPEGGPDGQVRDVLPLDPEAWHFLAASPGPLVLRQRDALILDNPFHPPADSWVALPLVAQGFIEGAVFGSSLRPISLGPLMQATLGSIADLVSAGVATARLRLDAQRMEIQRERLALVAELHDGLAQHLALAVREIAFLESDPAPDAARSSTLRLSEAVRAAHRVVRAELEDLAANVSEPGLYAAMETIIYRFAQRGMNVHLVGPVTPFQTTPAIVAVSARILNEALTNVERHARATHVSVTITADTDTMVMSVADQGVGFRTPDLPGLGDGHFGLTIMRARALSVGGDLSIVGKPDVGSTVELRIPLPKVTR